MKIYHNPNCTKSRQTLEIIKNKGIEPEVVNYLEVYLEENEILGLCEALSLSPIDIIRKKEALFKELGLETASEKELISAIKEHPVLLERPIVVSEGRAVIGRPPENVFELL